jgi:alpha-beta hydrolase superfamily lysophospholipase
MTTRTPGEMTVGGRARVFQAGLRTWVVRLTLTGLLIGVTLVVGGGVQAVLNVPDLQPWHRLVPRGELRAADLGETFTLDQYLAREADVFKEVRDEVETPVSASGSSQLANRYQSASISSPRRASRDWNRTFELTPAAVRGGALLIHGLTDGPYSMRAVAERLSAQGYYALALRVPGHGTVPGALTQATAEDWMAAVRMGARHVRRTIGRDDPMILVGYSNGGALIVRYALEAAADSGLPAPSRLVLISPMIGVSPLARIARVISALGPLPFFEKARWLEVVPEYNPFKYNSFPANAANQSYRVSSLVRAELADAARSGLVDRLPPILAFQSIVDATVSTSAVVRDLFDRLHGNGHELVVFDINRRAGLEPYIRPADAALAANLAAGGPRFYRRTLITNLSADVSEVRARSVAPGATTVEDVPLGLSWPAQVFSLSHVALPFAIDDPVYGSEPPDSPTRSIALGRLSPRGEKAVLTVPVETLMRIGWNPFLPFLLDRVVEWSGLHTGAGRQNLAEEKPRQDIGLK